MSPHYRIVRRDRYKYELVQEYVHILGYFEPRGHVTIARTRGAYWAKLFEHGLLHIEREYAWDGASGPAIDTTTMIRASLVHDVLYQMIAAGLLPMKPWKKHADLEFYRIMRMDGVPWWRAQYAYYAVRIFGSARDKYEP